MDMFAPLKPAAFHILLALAERDLHGYAAMQAVRELSGGQVPLQTGSFYRHLSRLIDEGFVLEAPGPKTEVDPRRGTHYRLTARGRQVLAAEQARMSSLVAHMKKLKLGAK
jgi:DNA-binding PadR family transcriptional regulator